MGESSARTVRTKCLQGVEGLEFYQSAAEQKPRCAPSTVARLRSGHKESTAFRGEVRISEAGGRHPGEWLLSAQAVIERGSDLSGQSIQTEWFLQEGCWKLKLLDAVRSIGVSG